MAGIRLFDTHYLWEDIVSMGLGVLDHPDLMDTRRRW